MLVTGGCGGGGMVTVGVVVFVGVVVLGLYPALLSTVNCVLISLLNSI